MPKPFRTFIADLAKKAGMAPENEALKAFIAATSELDNSLNIPEELEKGIDNQLISLKDAKNNHPEISAHYKATTLKGVDKVISDILDASELDEPTKTELKGEQNTFKVIPLLFNKLNEKKNGKAPEKNELQKQVDELQKQLLTKDQEITSVKVTSEKQLKDYQISSALDFMLSGYKTTLDELDGEVKATTIKTLLNKHLQDNSAQFAYDENGKLVLLKKDGTNYYGDNHQQVEPKKFVEQILSQNKLLKVSDSTGTNPGPTAPQGANGNSKANPAFQGLIDGAMKDISTASASMV